MPIAYSLDRENGCIVETWTGDVTAKELATHWRHYLADSEVLSSRCAARSSICAIVGSRSPPRSSPN